MSGQGKCLNGQCPHVISQRTITLLGDWDLSYAFHCLAICRLYFSASSTKLSVFGSLNVNFSFLNNTVKISLCMFEIIIILKFLRIPEWNTDLLSLDLKEQHVRNLKT